MHFCRQCWQAKRDSIWWHLVEGRVWASQVALLVKTPPANAGDIRDTGSIPGLGRSPGGKHGNPLQYSFLENAWDRAAWLATVHGVPQSQTWLSDLAGTHSGGYKGELASSSKSYLIAYSSYLFSHCGTHWKWEYLSSNLAWIRDFSLCKQLSRGLDCPNIHPTPYPPDTTLLPTAHQPRRNCPGRPPLLHLPIQSRFVCLAHCDRLSGLNPWRHAILCCLSGTKYGVSWRAER